jgi:hypothetical protein
MKPGSGFVDRQAGSELALLAEREAGSDVLVAVSVHDSDRQTLVIGSSDVRGAGIDHTDAQWHLVGNDRDVLENLVDIATARERGIPKRAWTRLENDAPGREIVVCRNLPRELVVGVVSVNDRCACIETAVRVLDDLARLARNVGVSPLGAAAVDCGLDDHRSVDSHEETPINAFVSRNSSKPSTPHSRPLPDLL